MDTSIEYQNASPECELQEVMAIQSARHLRSSGLATTDIAGLLRTNPLQVTHWFENYDDTGGASHSPKLRRTK